VFVLQGYYIGFQGTQHPDCSAQGYNAPEQDVYPKGRVQPCIQNKGPWNHRKTEKEDEENGGAVGAVVLAEIKTTDFAFIAQIKRDAGFIEVTLSAFRAFAPASKGSRRA
jgi:hypothetical protein